MIYQYETKKTPNIFQSSEMDQCLTCTLDFVVACPKSWITIEIKRLTVFFLQQDQTLNHYISVIMLIN